MAMPEAQKIQKSITTRLRKLKKQGKLTSEDYDYLFSHTYHKLYNLAKETGKLEGKLKEIKKIIEKKN